MKKEMLINVMQPEECRIAIIEDRLLEELYVERTSHESYVGNIYKGRIVNIEPSIQAAFVDFGVGRNGFLHVSDVEPAYYRHLTEGRPENGGRRRDRDRDRGGRPSRHGEEGGRPSQQRRPMPHPVPRAPEVDEEVPPETAPEAGLPLESEPVAERTQPAPRRGQRRRRDTQMALPEQVIGDATGHEEGPQPAYEAESLDVTAPDDNETLAREPDDTPPADPGRTLFMDSAERRTEDDHPAEGTLDAPADVDDDIFFPRQSSSAPDPIQEMDEEEPEAEARDEESPEPEAFQSQEDRDDDDDDETYQFEADEEMEELAASRLPEFAGDEGEPRRRGRRDNGRGRPRRGPGGGRPGMGRPKPLIQDIFKRGQEVLVQVIKEGIGTKGPTLSTYISIAGRYLVLMPGLNRVGVSRKIADDEQRRRLREIFNELKPPRGLGFIIRTAGLDKTKKELQRDLAYLSRLWQVVVRRIRKLKSPAEIYQESDMITRTIRDTFTNDIDTIWVDEPNAFEHAQEFLQIVMPRYANRIKFYSEPEPIFHKYGIEDEIARIQRRHVPLPNGGSIVIDQTEALVAIDVNSGNFRADNNAEETAYQMNLLAAREIARQLRLRDLGGVIVNDFIDMREEKHRRGVERAMRDAVKRDRARTKVLRISAFGIIEMTRQRIRPSLKRSVYQDCPHCLGAGQVKTCESMSIEVMRMLQLAAHRPNINSVHIGVAEDVAYYLLNKKRREISRLEEAGGIQVVVTCKAGNPPETLEFICYDNNNNEVKFLAFEEPRGRRR